MTTNVYVSSVAWTAVAAWAANTGYTLGQYVRQLAAPGYGNERVFKCTTAGTSHATTEPTWNKNNNATTTDNTVTWTQVAGQEAEQLAGNWRAPLANIETAASLLTAGFGVRVYASNDHVQTTSASLTIAPGNTDFVVSVSRTGATLPPTDADYLRGAQIITTGASNLNIGQAYFLGFDFKCGTGSSAAQFTVANANLSISHLEDCTLQLLSTNSGNVIAFESTSTFPGSTRMLNTKMKFSSTGQGIQIQASCVVEWFGTPTDAVDPTGSIPASLLHEPTNQPGRYVQMHGLDLSACSGNLYNNTPGGITEIYDCKLHASLTLPNTDVWDVNSYVRLTNCDDSGNGRNFRYYKMACGVNINSAVDVVLSGGASDGVTTYSHKYTYRTQGGAATFYYNPAYGDWISKRYNTTGSAKTVTIYAILFNVATMPTNVNFWMETEVLDTASVPLAGFHTTRTATPMASGTALTADSSAWDTGTVAARQNSHAYVVGDLIKLASNSGRVFYCTGAGASSGSEPGGYASAVDGGSVTDGSAVFRAGLRFKIAQSITPQVKGIVRSRLVQACVGSSGTSYTTAVLFLDPKLNIA